MKVIKQMCTKLCLSGLLISPLFAQGMTRSQLYMIKALDEMTKMAQLGYTEVLVYQDNLKVILDKIDTEGGVDTDTEQLAILTVKLVDDYRRQAILELQSDQAILKGVIEAKDAELKSNQSLIEAIGTSNKIADEQGNMLKKSLNIVKSQIQTQNLQKATFDMILLLEVTKKSCETSQRTASRIAEFSEEEHVSSSVFRNCDDAISGLEKIIAGLEGNLKELEKLVGGLKLYNSGKYMTGIKGKITNFFGEEMARDLKDARSQLSSVIKKRDQVKKQFDIEAEELAKDQDFARLKLRSYQAVYDSLVKNRADLELALDQLNLKAVVERSLIDEIRQNNDSIRAQNNEARIKLENSRKLEGYLREISRDLDQISNDILLEQLVRDGLNVGA